MAETKPLTAYWMHDVIRISEPLTIGKHAWRLVQYRGLENRYVIDEATGIRRHVETPRNLRRLRVAAARRAIRGLATGPRLAEVRLQRRTASRPAAEPAQALRRMPVGSPAPRRRHRHTGVARRYRRSGPHRSGPMTTRGRSPAADEGNETMDPIQRPITMGMSTRSAYELDRARRAGPDRSAPRP